MKRLKGDLFQVAGTAVTSGWFGVWQESVWAAVFLFSLGALIFYTLTESKYE